MKLTVSATKAGAAKPVRKSTAAKPAAVVKPSRWETKKEPRRPCFKCMSTKVKFGWKTFDGSPYRYVEVFCGRCGEHVQFERQTEEAVREIETNLFTGVEP